VLVELEPCGFEVGRFVPSDGKIRWLRGVVAMTDRAVGSLDGAGELIEEGGGVEAGGVGGGEQDAALFEEGQGCGDERGVIGFGAEDAAGFGTGKGGGIEQYDVEEALLSGEPAQPIEGVAVEECVLLGVEPVEGEVGLSPIEVFSGEIDAGGMGASEGRAGGESAGIGKGIENGDAGLFGIGEGKLCGDVAGEEAISIIALIEEKTDGIAFVEAEGVTNAVFEDREAVGGGWAEERTRGDGAGGAAAGLADQFFVIGAGALEKGHPLVELALLSGVKGAFGMAEEVGAEPIEVPTGLMIAGAVQDAVDVGFKRSDQSDAKRVRGVGAEVGLGGEVDGFVGGRVPEAETLSVEENAGSRGSAVERIAEDGKTELRGVDADLMRAPGERAGFDEVVAEDFSEWLEPGLGEVGTGMGWSAEVTWAGADEGGAGKTRLRRGGTVGEEKVTFIDGVLGELAGEGLVGAGGFGEEEDAGSFFIETLGDAECRPARVTMSEPVVEALIMVRVWGVGIDAWGFIDDEEVIVFEEDTGEGRGGHQKNHAPFQATQVPRRRLVMAWAVMASPRRLCRQTRPW
jgi:hypothetical protein